MITRQTHAFLMMFMFQTDGEPSTACTKLTGAVATTKNTNGINLLNLSKSFCHPSIHPIHLSYRSIHSFHQFVPSIHLSSIHPFIHSSIYHSTLHPIHSIYPFIHPVYLLTPSILPLIILSFSSTFPIYTFIHLFIHPPSIHPSFTFMSSIDSFNHSFNNPHR